MNRRQFLGTAGAAAALSLLPGGVTEALARPSERPAPRKHQLTKLGCQRYPPTPETFRYYARHGVSHYTCSPPLGKIDDWTVDGLLKFREQVEGYGITLELIQLGMSPYTMLGKSPERDREIEQMCRVIEKVSTAGIHGIKYNLTPRNTLRTESREGRGGVLYSTFDLEKVTKDSPVLPTGALPEDVLWENVSYFLERVMPVAKQYRVRMACHPEDTPLPKNYRGIGQILGSVEGMKRFVSIAENDYHGFNFCQGTVAEMLADPGKEIYDVIRYFGERKKIFMVHFRNIRGKRGNFYETYPDEGDVDMLKAMRVYRDVGYEHMIIPDHLPVHPEDPDQKQGFAFAYGYMRALMQAVNEEK